MSTVVQEFFAYLFSLLCHVLYHFWSHWRQMTVLLSWLKEYKWMLVSGWESQEVEIYVTCISKRWKLACLEYVSQFCPEICSQLALFSWRFLVWFYTDYIYKYTYLGERGNCFGFVYIGVKKNLPIITEVLSSINE